MTKGECKMYVTVKYEIPVNDFIVIPEGSRLEMVDTWGDYEGFVAVKYNDERMFINELYFDPIPACIEA
jgi:hypothetical protein